MQAVPWLEELRQIPLLPRAAQAGALLDLSRRLGDGSLEAWNTRFAPESLYEAWTELPLLTRLYEANRAVIQPVLQERASWHVVEIGGGNGALWRRTLRRSDQGTLTLIDPSPAAHAAVATAVPESVKLDSRLSDVEQAAIPPADVVVCSLTLHHVAGLDADQRRCFGLAGEGKREVLQRCIDAIRDRRGVCILNEADVYNELDLAPSDPVLIDHFIDVYVRRCAMAILATLDQAPAEAIRERWLAIVRRWCIDQVRLADAPREARDVYELDAVRWRDLVQSAGGRILQERYTDDWYLFRQYVFDAPDSCSTVDASHGRRVGATTTD